MNKKMLSTIFAIIFGISLVGCSKAYVRPITTEEVSVSNEYIERAKAYIPSKEEALKTLGMSKKGETVITMSFTETMMASTAGVKIVGIPNDKSHLQSYVYKNAEMIVNDIGEIQYDRIKALRPSLVIFDNGKAKDKEFVGKLDEMGIKYYITNEKTYQDSIKNVGLLAAAFGTEKEASVQIGKKLERLDKSVALNKGQTKKVAVVVVEADGIKVPLEGNYIDSLIKESKTINIGPSIKTEGEPDRFGLVKTTLNEVVKGNPDGMVILVRVKRPLRNQTEKDFIANLKKSYPNAEFVKNNRFKRADHHIFLPRWIDCVSAIENINATVNR